MVFNIKNLECKYKTGSNSVLVLDNLQIKKGEVVFFLGASGVGKSTILETLGLMNNTINANPKTVFNFKNDGVSKSMIDIWGEKESYLADFRKKNLSFIFQSTNLFPTLNAENNVLLTPMLQGMSEVQAKNTTRSIFKKIFEKEYREILGDKGEQKTNIFGFKYCKVHKGKKISEMSGGQRQRLAFVRAIASNYNILLADEPTGNLDWANANNLMSHLISDIKSKGATSIIVSHDISLAVQHADKIVYIDKIKSTLENNNPCRLENESNKTEYHHGLINDANTYVRQAKGGWNNQVSYDKMEPPLIDDTNLIEYFKDKIIKQNSKNA